MSPIPPSVQLSSRLGGDGSKHELGGGCYGSVLPTSLGLGGGV